MKAIPLRLAALLIVLGLLAAAPAPAAAQSDERAAFDAEEIAEELAERGEPDQPLLLADELSDNPLLWHLHNYGQIQGGSADADIDWPEAMAIDDRDPRYDNRIGVIDSGISFTHPELHGKICEQEIPGNDIDDDGNGFIDDAWGWDFIQNDKLPQDTNGHGTFVSGLIAARNSPDGMGAIGAAREACIVAIRVFGNSGQGKLSTMLAGIRYAVRLRLPVVNISAGITDHSPALAREIRRARAQGVLIVAAAGNNGANSDKHPFYPAALPGEHVVSVAASTAADHLADFSNWGRKTVDLAAPGRSVRSTRHIGDVGGGSGTSYAAPLVSAAASEVLRRAPQLGPRAVRRKLLAGVDKKSALAGRMASGGRLSIAGALERVGSDRKTYRPAKLRAKRLGKARGSRTQRRKHRFVRFSWKPGEAGQRFWLVVDGQVRKSLPRGKKRVRIRLAKRRHRAFVIAADRAGNEARSRQIRFR